MIRRPTSSILKFDEAGATLSLRSCMPIHEVKTVKLSYREEEAVDVQ